ncbi:MAG: DUF3489 domain-containing protein [Proteobacteria bacterium]|nr:DUF3489 domain-containing protein [Pseudomonadota bacterium]
MPKLSETQLVILSAAAGRKTRAVLPLPKSLKISKGAAANVLKALINKGLIEEHPAGPRTEVWREDKTGRRFTLTISDAGLETLDAGPAKLSPKRPKKRPGNASPSGAPRGKAGTILALLSRPKGARINDLQKATGWQAHSIRAAITGLRKRGITITRSQDDGVTVYRAEAD